MTATPAPPNLKVASIRSALSSRGSQGSSVSFRHSLDEHAQEADGGKPVVPPLPSLKQMTKGEDNKNWLTARTNMTEVITSERERLKEERRRKTRKAGLDTGKCKKPVKQQMGDLMDELTKLMAAEWQQIVKMAPSLKSGTGVVEEVLLRKLHVIIKKLNVLCVTRPEAAEFMIVKVNQLDRERVQLLMKMLDALDYPLLTDYVRTCINNSSKLRPLQATQSDLARPERHRTSLTSGSNPNAAVSPLPDGGPTPGPQEMMIFTKPSVKSDFPDKAANIHAKSDKKKGWADGGLSREVRKLSQGLKEPEADVRHQFVSGWNTGGIGSSSLFIDPVSGHGHTPVYAPYDSDDEEAAREQIGRIQEVKIKLAEAENEAKKRLAKLNEAEERARILRGESSVKGVSSLQSTASTASSERSSDE